MTIANYPDGKSPASITDRTTVPLRLTELEAITNVARALADAWAGLDLDGAISVATESDHLGRRTNLGTIFVSTDGVTFENAETQATEAVLAR